MESIENPLPNSSINFVPGSVKSSSFHITIHGKPEIVLWIFFCYSTAEIHRQRASLPPDGTTFLHLSLGELQKKTIPSYSYWNFQVSIMLFLRYFLRYNWSNFGQLWTSRYRSISISVPPKRVFLCGNGFHSSSRFFPGFVCPEKRHSNFDTQRYPWRTQWIQREFSPFAIDCEFMIFKIVVENIENRSQNSRKLS